MTVTYDQAVLYNSPLYFYNGADSGGAPPGLRVIIVSGPTRTCTLVETDDGEEEES